jgi:glycosyltransferase involved in cell wall biosynthesis
MTEEIIGIKSPVYLIPKLDIADPKSSEILQRLDFYAEVFYSINFNNSMKLRVAVTNSKDTTYENFLYKNLEIIIVSRRVISFLLKVRFHRKIISPAPSTLIAGDLVYGFISALLIKYPSRYGTRIQTQIHGDTYSSSTVNSLKSFLRILVTRLNLYCSNSIRIVSEFQIEELKRFTRSETDFVVSPIPLNYKKISTNRLTNRSGIGLIGRIHKERGLDEFLEIMYNLQKRRISELVYVIGEGPGKKFLLKKLKNSDLDNSVVFLGHLTPDELCIQYARLKVMISCAPTEGYGLSLREAALSGVQVVARKSAGSIAASQDFGSHIHLYSSIGEASDLIVENLLKESAPFSNLQTINLQKKREIQGLKNWVNSW